MRYCCSQRELPNSHAKNTFSTTVKKKRPATHKRNQIEFITQCKRHQRQHCQEALPSINQRDRGASRPPSAGMQTQAPQRPSALPSPIQFDLPRSLRRRQIHQILLKPRPPPPDWSAPLQWTYRQLTPAIPCVPMRASTPLRRTRLGPAGKGKGGDKPPHERICSEWCCCRRAAGRWFVLARTTIKPANHIPIFCVCVAVFISPLGGGFSRS